MTLRLLFSLKDIAVERPEAAEVSWSDVRSGEEALLAGDLDFLVGELRGVEGVRG